MASLIRPYYRPAPIHFRDTNLEIFYAVEVDLNDETLRLYTGLGEIDLPTNTTSDKIYLGAGGGYDSPSDYAYCDDQQTLVFERAPDFSFSQDIHEAGDMTYSEWSSLFSNSISYAGIFPVLANGYPDTDNEITEGVTKSLERLVFDVSEVSSLPSNFIYFWQGKYGDNNEQYIPFTVDTNVTTQTFTGAGNMIGISDVENSTEIKYPSLSLSLSGLPTDIVSNEVYDAALNDQYQGNPITLYCGSIDPVTKKPSLMVLYKGNLDVMTIANSGNAINISVTVKNRLQTLLRNKNLRYTEQRQLADFAGDTSLQYVTDLQDLEIEWG